MNGDEQYGDDNEPNEEKDEEIEVQLEIQEVQQNQQQQGIPDNFVDCRIVIADDEAEEADAEGNKGEQQLQLVEQQQHYINYAANLSVKATNMAGHHEKRMDWD